MDNDYAIVFIRGEAGHGPKYDILKHPYIKLTEDGGAAPYTHHPGLTYVQEDMSLPFESLETIEIIDGTEEFEYEKRPLIPCAAPAASAGLGAPTSARSSP